MKGELRRIKSINRYEAKTLLISILVGALVAPLAMSLPVVINALFDLASRITDLPGGSIWLIVPLIIAGLAVGLLTRKIAPEAEGSGLHVAAAAFNTEGSRLRARTVPFKYLATVITTGAGSTTGVVSPSALIGYSLGSSIAYRLKLEPDRVRTIGLCGLAAAISALLETPLGAAVFAVEIAYRNRILYRRFFYCLASSIVAFLISIVLRPNKPFLDIPGDIPSLTVVDLLTMIFIALAVTILCILYIWSYQYFHNRFIRMNWKGYGWLKPAFGFLLAGSFIIPVFTILKDLGYIGGYSGNLLPFEDLNISRMALVAVVLFITTALIAGSGNSGGLFMPIMTFGAIFGVAIASLFTDTAPVVFAAVGMTAAIATTLNVPLAAVVICAELFGLPAFLPAILGSLTGYFIGKRYVIYHEIKWSKLKAQ